MSHPDPREKGKSGAASIKGPVQMDKHPTEIRLTVLLFVLLNRLEYHIRIAESRRQGINIADVATRMEHGRLVASSVHCSRVVSKTVVMVVSD